MILSNYRGFNSNRRGLHWTPSPYHAHVDLTYFIDRCKDMDIKWICLLDDGGGSSLQSNPYYNGKSIVQMFQERGIETVIRLYAPASARFDARMEDTVRRLVAAGVKYIFWQNEPEVGSTEWQNRPKDWVRVVTRNFVEGAYKIIALGGYPGAWATTTWLYPDENGNPVNPFKTYMTEQERQDIFVNGPGFIVIHPYSKNHPLEYPRDEVNLTGKHMTPEEYQFHLSEVDPIYRQTQHLWVYDDYQTSEHHINFVRDRGINPNASLATDDVCFRMYQGILQLLDEVGLRPYVPLIGGEVGPCVGDRDDGRYPKVTPQQHVRMIQVELDEARTVPNLFALCFWLAGVSRLGTITADSFEDQGWWTDRHNEPFNLKGEMPIVEYLINNKGSVMSSKLFPHIQNLRDYTLTMIRDTQPEYIKIMGNALNPDKIALIKQAAPNARLIGRYHLDSQPYDNPEVNAAQLVTKIAETGCGPLVWAWESYNETAVSTLSPVQVKNLDRFFAEFHRLVRIGFGVEHTIVVNSPTGNLGWAGEVSPADFTESLSLDGTIVSSHHYEYHQAPANDRTAFLFRWKKHVEQVLAKFPHKKFLFTEVGVTELALGYPHPDVGWKYNGTYSESEYMKVLYDLDNEMQKYPAILGACVFQTGCNDDWLTFESSEQVRKHRLSFVPIEEPPVVIKNPIRVKMSSGEIKTLELEEYLRFVIPNEVYATWAMECLKAQSVAARTYALYCIDHPAGTDYDLTDTTLHQIFNPNVSNIRTDQAVKDTAGLYIKNSTGEYKARCGLTVCPSCLGQNGTNGKTWPDQLCQFGSQSLALSGKTFREIIRFYYGDVLLSDENESEEPPVTEWVLERVGKTEAYEAQNGKVVGCAYKVKEYPARENETYWRVKRIKFLGEDEAKGDVNVYLYLEDEYGDPMDGEVSVAWPSDRLGTGKPWDQQITIPSLVVKPASFTQSGFDPVKNPVGPFVFWANLLPSDVIYGAGLPGNRHVVGEITFRKYTKKATTPPPVEPPIEPPAVITEEDLRNAAWNKIGVNYNPQAGFPSYAREHGLGAPLSNEFDFGNYRIQAFVQGFVYAVIGDWGNIKHSTW